MTPSKYGVSLGHGMSEVEFVGLPTKLLPEARFVAFGFNPAQAPIVELKAVPVGHEAHVSVVKLNN